MCEISVSPPGMAGPVDSVLDVSTLEKWKAYRRARVEERMLEAWDPQQVRNSYRIRQSQIDAGCYTINELVDLGRALFLREFTLAEGLGNYSGERHWFERFQKKGTQSAHATSCVSCHWKGGFAGAGDRVDNAFFDGDGNTQSSHLERNPIALIGAGWIENLALEMTIDLQRQKQLLVRRASDVVTAKTKLRTKGIEFGEISTRRHKGQVLVDYSKLEGVDKDLIVRPFGWQGRYAKLSDMVEWSFSSHLGLSINSQHNNQQELLRGQITAITLFIATLPTPIIQIPTVGGFRPDKLIPVAKPMPAPEFTTRWAVGQHLFSEIGCGRCHRPSMQLISDDFETAGVKLSLHDIAANPRPEKIEQVVFREPSSTPTNVATRSTSASDDSATRLFLFSDLKLHQMGYGRFLTRPLWGLRNSAPYSFDGGANVIDQAVEKHHHPRSAARIEAEKFIKLPHSEKAELRIFLYSLMRLPEIRVR